MRAFFLGGRFLLLTSLCPVAAKSAFTELFRFPAPEARQGVAVDERFVFVIDNVTIAKYDKATHQRLVVWTCPVREPLIHLNAGIVLDGKLYCAHSNYPGVPMTSSVEVWDVETLQHVESHSFGIFAGSLTWVDRRDGFWYAAFAHYGNRAAEPGKDNRWTTLVRLDSEWRPVQSWVFPPELLQRFGIFSTSGGGWGPDGRLYVTGHDEPELYVLELPSGGSVLRWVDTVPVPAEGQAFAWDKSDPGVIYSILRRTREVVVGRVSFSASRVRPGGSR